MAYELLSQSMTLNMRGGRNRSGVEEGVGKLFKKKQEGRLLGTREYST